jgi:hypothetical protein
VYRVKAIHQVANAKEPQSANLGRILSIALTAPALPFWADPAPITCAVSARFGYTLKDPASDSITTQLESIAR